MCVERHPFTPFLPEGCRVLMLGSFPPAEKRWAVRFYYPNYTNDMWRIFGLCLYGDKMRLVDAGHKTYRLDLIIPMLQTLRIGLYDTATAVRRLRNTASDKDLEVVEPTDLRTMIDGLPQCEAVVTTGQKATDVLAGCFGITQQPKVGQWTMFDYKGRTMRLYRMPSSSRAYPLRVERKAEIYQPLFDWIRETEKQGQSRCGSVL